MISGGEIIVIFIVVLIVFGPKRIPELGRALGKVMQELNKAMQDIKVQMETDHIEIASQDAQYAANPNLEERGRLSVLHAFCCGYGLLHSQDDAIYFGYTQREVVRYGNT